MAEQGSARQLLLGSRELASSLRKQWDGMQPGPRRIVLGAAALTVAGLLVVAILAARGPAMDPLFTNLNPQDGSAIVTQLQQQKIPYTLADNGQTILVPRKDVAAERLSMAGQGLPAQGTVGLGTVLNLPFGATDFTRQVAYQQGLQNELAGTISQIKGVQGARVQLVLPQTQTFSGQSTPASAGVLVQLSPGASLAPTEVQGIVHLVSSSVQGLNPTAITVLDQHGDILATDGSVTGLGQVAGGGSATASGGSGPAAQAQTDLAVQQQFQQQLQSGLNTLLAQVFGPGNVVTQVQAQLNFNSGTSKATLFSPSGSSPAVLQSLQQLHQTTSGGGVAAGGTPGTASNSFPTYTAGSNTSNSDTSSSLSETFDVSQQDTNTTIVPGTVSRLSVAVVVNRQLSASEQQLIASTVSAAVGADPARQDQINVVGIPFNQSLTQALAHAPSGAAHIPARDLVIAGAAAAVLLGVIVLLLTALRRGPREVSLDGITSSGAPATDGLLPELDLEGALSRSQRTALEGSLRQHPQDVAQVIRAWLGEDN